MRVESSVFIVKESKCWVCAREVLEQVKSKGRIEASVGGDLQAKSKNTSATSWSDIGDVIHSLSLSVYSVEQLNTSNRKIIIWVFPLRGFALVIELKTLCFIFVLDYFHMILKFMFYLQLLIWKFFKKKYAF